MGGGTGGDFGATKGSGNSIIAEHENKRLFGNPNTVTRRGYKETYIGKDGRAYKEIHHTDHGNPKYHTNPHEHVISWTDNNKPVFTKK